MWHVSRLIYCLHDMIVSIQVPSKNQTELAILGTGIWPDSPTIGVLFGSILIGTLRHNCTCTKENKALVLGAVSALSVNTLVRARK